MKCPNCKHYKVSKLSTEGWVAVVLAILSIPWFTIGIGIFVFLVCVGFATHRFTANEKYKCSKCGWQGNEIADG